MVPPAGFAPATSRLLQDMQADVQSYQSDHARDLLQPSTLRTELWGVIFYFINSNESNTSKNKNFIQFED